MTWSIEFLEEAEKDIKKFDHSVQIQVLRVFEKLVKIRYLQKKADMVNL